LVNQSKMNYKNFEMEDIEYSIRKETNKKYSKKVNHKKNNGSYSRKGKNKFSMRDIDY
jgi:hypothetical protein